MGFENLMYSYVVFYWSPCSKQVTVVNTRRKRLKIFTRYLIVYNNPVNGPT